MPETLLHKRGSLHRVFMRALSVVRTFASFVLVVGAFIFLLAIVAKISRDKDQLWDFKNYYAPVKVMQAGLDPYDNNNFKIVFPDGQYKRWQYPPIVLNYFAPFALLPYESARQLWLACNLIFAFFLVAVWHRYLVNLNPDALTCWFILLAFNGTFVWGLASGNIALFEQLLLFLGIGLFLQKRYILFATCVAFAAQFKLIPIAFLGLLLLTDPKPRWKALLVGLGLFSIVYSTNYLFYPDLVSRFYWMASTDQLDPPSDVSLLNFVNVFTSWISGRANLTAEAAAKITWVIYVCIVGVILCVSYAVFRYSRERISQRQAVLYFCVIYCLAVPRLLAYAPITAIASTLFLLKSKDLTLRIPLILAFVLPVMYYPVADDFFHKLRLFAPLIALGVIWLCFSRMLLDSQESPLADQPRSIDSEIPATNYVS